VSSGLESRRQRTLPWQLHFRKCLRSRLILKKKRLSSSQSSLMRSVPFYSMMHFPFSESCNR
jgi:hypothetical protein